MVTGSLVTISQWTFNKITGLAEVPLKKLNILPEANYDINITGQLGIIKGPVDISFNHTFEQLANWTKKDLVIYETITSKSP